jgi:hypothetical protein
MAPAWAARRRNAVGECRTWQKRTPPPSHQVRSPARKARPAPGAGSERMPPCGRSRSRTSRGAPDAAALGRGRPAIPKRRPPRPRAGPEACADGARPEAIFSATRCVRLPGGNMAFGPDRADPVGADENGAAPKRLQRKTGPAATAASGLRHACRIERRGPSSAAGAPTAAAASARRRRRNVLLSRTRQDEAARG